AERLEYQHSDLDLIEHMHPPYTAMVTKLSAAGLASMALAPETPQAPLMVRDVGDGTSLHLSWTVTNTEPDFAGYRVAWRYADSLFYEQIVPVGMVTEFTLTGLTPDAPIYISYSALDTAGNESIFSQEVLEAPNQIPQTPIGLASTSTPAGVELSWLPNNELDLAGYTITRTAPDGSTQTFEVDSTTTAFLDNTLQPHILYQYTLQARDNDGNLSPPTDVVYGQLATHDQGIMILDASRDGPGVPILPTDEQVDNFYATILSDFNIARQWDIADSARGITDADMAPFSTVIIHTDVRLPSHLLSSDTLALRKYLQNGGKLLLIGWEAIFSVSENGETIKTFFPGEFVYDYLKTDRVERAAGSDFRGADPLISGAGYPPISVDSVKIPNFGGNLLGMEAFRSLVDTLNTEAIYAYRSSAQPPSPLHGVPVALRHLTGTLQVVVIDFPLYYMEEPQARQAITQALLDLGETTGIGDEDTGVNAPVHFELHQNYPNPFNPSTVIRYALPQTADVRLEIYNLLGQRIATLVNRRQTRGRYTVIWDGRDQSGKPVASGIYLYRLEADHFVQVRKLVLLR
ncbi:MAG: T9SS C-terminal target domain-containing protein, partial [Calditrichaeota bacterium]